MINKLFCAPQFNSTRHPPPPAPILLLLLLCDVISSFGTPEPEPSLGATRAAVLVACAGQVAYLKNKLFSLH